MNDQPDDPRAAIRVMAERMAEASASLYPTIPRTPSEWANRMGHAPLEQLVSLAYAAWQVDAEALPDVGDALNAHEEAGFMLGLAVGRFATSVEIGRLLDVHGRLLALANTFRAAGVLADEDYSFLPENVNDHAYVWNSFADELDRLRQDVLAASEGGKA